MRYYTSTLYDVNMHEKLQAFEILVEDFVSDFLNELLLSTNNIS